MRRHVPALLLACGALALVAGCGSSKSSSAGSSSTSATGPTSGLHRIDKINYAKPPTSGTVKSGLVQVVYRNIAIEPDTLKVKVGSIIKWTNDDSVEHNVTSAGGPVKFASKNFGEGGTFEFKATKPGVIHYRCTIHPVTMNGTIEVVR